MHLETQEKLSQFDDIYLNIKNLDSIISEEELFAAINDTKFTKEKYLMIKKEVELNID